MKNIRWIILSLIGIANIHGDSWIFKSKKEAKAAFPNSNIVCKEIVDPSYDQTFKMVMSTDSNKQKYLMSFLNSIYFPGAKGEDVMIRRIEALDKENEKMKEPQKKKTKKSEKSSNNITLCDVACKCIYYADHSSEDSGDRRKRSSDEIEEAFDLEMQRSKQTKFTIRLMNYGLNLQTRNKVCVKALGLLNFPKEKFLQDESACYAWCKINPKTNQPERLTEKENILETNTIDLRKLAKDEDIYINGKELDIVGITWLKLFGVKQWCEPSDNGVKYKIYYPEDEIDKNIKKVIEIILSCINQEYYQEMLRVIENAQDILNTAKNEGIEIGKTEGIEIGRMEEELKNILIRDIKKYKKATNANAKKPKTSEKKRKQYNFAKRLKSMEIQELEDLLTEKQRNSEVAKAYFKAIGAKNVLFDDKSMEEEEF